MAATSFKLNNGETMPALGLGTWQSKPGEVSHAVSFALKNGYKLVDCAYCYGNEDEVGEGLKQAFAAGVKREDIYVMTKAWATYNTRVEECLDKSLKSLGLDYVDMYLIVSNGSLPRTRDSMLTIVFVALARPHEPQRQPRQVPYPPRRLSRYSS